MMGIGGDGVRRAWRGAVGVPGLSGPRKQTGQSHPWRKYLRYDRLTSRLVNVPVVPALMPSSLGHGVVKEGSAGFRPDARRPASRRCDSSRHLTEFIIHYQIVHSAGAGKLSASRTSICPPFSPNGPSRFRSSSGLNNPESRRCDRSVSCYMSFLSIKETSHSRPSRRAISLMVFPSCCNSESSSKESKSMAGLPLMLITVSPIINPASLAGELS